ncbi:MAG: hypothetical protein ACRDB0_05045 [Paraclostridium sp.]
MDKNKFNIDKLEYFYKKMEDIRDFVKPISKEMIEYRDGIDADESIYTKDEIESMIEVMERLNDITEEVRNLFY